MKIVRTAVAGLAGLVLAACSSTTAGTGTATATSTAASSASSSATSSSASSTASSTSKSSESAESSTSSGDVEIDPVAAELITKIAGALSQVTSMSGTLNVDTGTPGSNVDATFDQTLSNGTATGIKMTLGVGGQSIDILYVDDRLLIGGAFAQQYGGQWVEATASSTDPTLSQMYTQFQSTIDSSGISQYLDFLQLATNTVDVGPEQVNGVDTEKYTLDLDITRVDSAQISDATRESLTQIAAAGVDTVPCTFWVDANGLIQQVQQQFEVQGQSVTTNVTFSNYNGPVDVTAPDPSTVVTK